MMRICFINQVDKTNKMLGIDLQSIFYYLINFPQNHACNLIVLFKSKSKSTQRTELHIDI